MSTDKQTNDSIVFYKTRDGQVLVTDGNSIPHTDDLLPIYLLPIYELVADLMRLGYTGIYVEEVKRPRGGYLMVLDLDLNKAEGRVVQRLRGVDPLPTLEEVLEAIKSEAAQAVTN